MSVPEHLVAGRRQPVRHTIYHAVPHLLNSQLSNLGSGNRLRVGCDHFFDPMMAFLDRRKTEVNHLVSQVSVFVEIGAAWHVVQPRSSNWSESLETSIVVSPISKRTRKSAAREQYSFRARRPARADTLNAARRVT
jgi:hypothetical protein